MTRPSPTLLHAPEPAQEHGDRVILVHGTLDRSSGFRRVAAALPAWTVLSWDRRGWGGSRPLGDPADTLEVHVGDLGALLAETPGAIVAGHSYGGVVALAAAARWPDRVRAVVAFEPPLRWLPWWPDEAPWDRLAGAADSPPAAVEALLRAVLGEDRWRRLPAASRAQLVEHGAVALTEMADASLDEPAFDPLELEVPVLAAAGSASLPHHQDVPRRLAALVPRGAYVTIEGASHIAHVTHPAQFAALVTSAAGIT
ncbi:alpha/beta hydrolase [Nonomuraea angiospora]|uniref:alpha/beta fold hydrolase n=1 Tax=Nonomuraea angiospora TaxID=46172 RepID=UPI0033EBCFEA